MASRKEGGRRKGTEPAAEKDAGRDRPRPAGLVDFDPWGALLGAMGEGPGGEAAGEQPAQASPPTDVPAGHARPGKSDRSPRKSRS
jgi:hypothetical protein